MQRAWTTLSWPRGFTHLAVAPGTAGGLAVVAGDAGSVAGAGEAAGPGDLVAADLAVDLLVGADAHEGDVEVALAVAAGQALLVVHLVVDVHLLGLKSK